MNRRSGESRRSVRTILSDKAPFGTTEKSRVGLVYVKERLR